MPPAGDLAYNLGVCPDWESNQQPLSLQDSAQSTEPHQPGLFLALLLYIFNGIQATIKCLKFDTGQWIKFLHLKIP